jgi:hypothetical protein
VRDDTLEEAEAALQERMKFKSCCCLNPALAAIRAMNGKV